MCASSTPFDDERDLVQDIIERAATDAQFRRRLLEESEAAIRDEFGVRPAEGFDVRFIEKPEDVDALIVLPDFRPDGRLTEKELDEVAGGTGDGSTKWQEDDG